VKLHIEIRDARAREALRRAPDVVARHLEQALARGAEEVARAARNKAAGHDAFGTLRNSIRTERVGELHQAVVAGTNYARAVEEGTGPAVGKDRYFPDWTALIPYVRTKQRRGGEKLKRAGSKARFFQEREFENRAFALARYISHHGTQAYPFMRPAKIEKESRVRELVRLAARRGAREALA
jgi:hypothetical protein